MCNNLHVVLLVFASKAKLEMCFIIDFYVCKIEGAFDEVLSKIHLLQS